MDLKENLQAAQRKGLNYIVDADGSIRRHQPWLGDAFAFLYDGIMRRSVFPKKFGGDIEEHGRIMKAMLADTHGKRVLELATGSGSAADFLPPDNAYTGTDISAGLLRRATRRFHANGFSETGFYVVPAEALPFPDNAFDVCLCVLALNFFEDQECVLTEVQRVLAPGGVFFCIVPVPERKQTASPIRGQLRSEEEVSALMVARGFQAESLPEKNGCLLYLKACLAG